ncbi:hypothetical protein [Deinococcus aluminii]|uniref:Lipoprotein n=1 Tax=Deinococcus aluminii TaxID=1656885 RepID=A0ABP9XEK2_9DEIO
MNRTLFAWTLIPSLALASCGGGPPNVDWKPLAQKALTADPDNPHFCVSILGLNSGSMDTELRKPEYAAMWAMLKYGAKRNSKGGATVVSYQNPPGTEKYLPLACYTPYIVKEAVIAKGSKRNNDGTWPVHILAEPGELPAWVNDPVIKPLLTARSLPGTKTYETVYNLLPPQ